MNMVYIAEEHRDGRVSVKRDTFFAVLAEANSPDTHDERMNFLKEKYGDNLWYEDEEFGTCDEYDVVREFLTAHWAKRVKGWTCLAGTLKARTCEARTCDTRTCEAQKQTVSVK